MTWNDSADFYVVSAYKLKYYAGYGYELADTPYDTIVTTSVCRLPRGEFSRSTVTGGYDLLEVHFVGINGPEPASWDTLPSFDGRGMALGFSYENDFELLVPIGSAVLAKGLAAGTPPPRVGDPYAAVLRALKLSAPQ